MVLFHLSSGTLENPKKLFPAFGDFPSPKDELEPARPNLRVWPTRRKALQWRVSVRGRIAVVSGSI